jgi:transcription elongation factor Elf1
MTSSCPVCGNKLIHPAKPKNELEKHILCPSCTNYFEIVCGKLIKQGREQYNQVNHTVLKGRITNKVR